MRSLSSLPLAFVLSVLVGACEDSPVEPPEPPPSEGLVPALAMANAPTPPPCTKRWANGVTGLWSDPLAWSPIGLPTPSDDVCITAAGSYTVTAYAAVDVGSLTLGTVSGADVTLDLALPPNSTSYVGDMLTIRPSATFRISSQGHSAVLGEDLVNHGLLDVDNVCACGTVVGHLHFWGRFLQTGRAEIDAPSLVHVADYVLSGPSATLVTAGTGTLDMLSFSTLTLDGGLVAGTAPIRPDHLVWNAGQVDDIAPATSAVQVLGGSITLDASEHDRSGMVEATSGMGSYGGIEVNFDLLGADEEIQLSTYTDAPVRLSGLRGPAVIEGELSIAATGVNDITLGPDGVINRGEFNLNGTGSVRFVAEGGDRPDLVNESELAFDWPDVEFAVSGGTLRNEGEITSLQNKTLTIGDNATFEAVDRSDLGMALVLEGGTLTGSGDVSSVTSISGAIVPGAPYGVLDARDVTLDELSQLIIQIADTLPGSYGQLRSTGDVTLGGLLVIAPTLGSDVGHCGDAITPILHDRGVRKKAFSGTLGGQTGSTGWRIHATSDSLMLLGVPPTTEPLVLDRKSVNVAEGGATAQARVCLTGSAPTSHVVVAPTPVDRQVTATPRMTFTKTDWMLPRTLDVTAVQDAVVEASIHSDLIQFGFQAGPGEPPEYTGIAQNSLNVSIEDEDGNADLSIAAIHPSVSAAAGGSFEVEFRITNDGPTLSTGSTFALNSSGPATFALVSDFQMSCTDHVNGRIVCDVESVASGSTLTVAMTLDALGAGSSMFDVTITGDQDDADPANNTTSVAVTVN